MIIRVRKSFCCAVSAALVLLAVCIFYLPQGKPAAAQKSLRIPIIMYHQISRKTDNIGRYIINSEELEKDLKYIKSLGYETVGVSDIVSFVSGEKELPEKCVMLTFDDGYETGYTILYPLLQKYNMKAVISVIGSLTELYTENEDHNDRYSYLDESEIKLLSKTEEVEIENHSYNMHYCEKGRRKGINKLYSESVSDYEKAITEDVGKMQEYLFSLTGVMPKAIAYPFGECCEETVSVCESLGFSVTFTCEEKVSTITKYRPETLYNLGRYNRSGTSQRESFFSKILT